MQPISFIIVCVACVALAQAASITDQVTAAVKKCASDTKVSAEQAKIAFVVVLPKTDKENCYVECIYKAVGIITNNKYNLNGAKKLVVERFTDPAEKAAADKLVDTCAKKVSSGSGKCAVGKAVRECFVKYGKDVSFFPPPS